MDGTASWDPLSPVQRLATSVSALCAVRPVRGSASRCSPSPPVTQDATFSSVVLSPRKTTNTAPLEGHASLDVAHLVARSGGCKLSCVGPTLSSNF